MSESLYKRLGGAEGITQIANDLIDIHLSNPAIAPRFTKLKRCQISYYITQIEPLLVHVAQYCFSVKF